MGWGPKKYRDECRFRVYDRLATEMGNARLSGKVKAAGSNRVTLQDNARL